MKFLCRIGIHKWGRWSYPYHVSGEIYGKYYNNITAQSTSCLECGAVNEKILGYSLYGSRKAREINSESFPKPPVINGK